MAVTVEPAPLVEPSLQARLFGQGALLNELIRTPAGLGSLIAVSLVVVVALAAPLLAPSAPNAIMPLERFASPSWGHLLGNDYLGRDTLSRVIYGTRYALAIAVPAALLGFAVGLALGVVAGYLGGVLDKALTVLLDSLLSLPAFVLALAVMTLVGPSFTSTMLLIALALVPGYQRLARAQVLVLKESTYIKAERALGAGRGRIILRHIMPNTIPSLVILVAMDIPGAIGFEAGLAFLGLGVQPPTADWGVMLRDAFIDFRTAPWPLIGPLAAIGFVTGAFTLLGETLRDLSDPRLAGARLLRPRLLARVGRGRRSPAT